MQNLQTEISRNIQHGQEIEQLKAAFQILYTAYMSGTTSSISFEDVRFIEQIKNKHNL